MLAGAWVSTTYRTGHAPATCELLNFGFRVYEMGYKARKREEPGLICVDWGVAAVKARGPALHLQFDAGVKRLLAGVRAPAQIQQKLTGETAKQET